MSRQFRCPCGELSAPTSSNNIGQMAEQSGFYAIWDVRNGLTALWLCPLCAEKIHAAWTTIVAVAKTDTLNMSGFATNYERGREAKRAAHRQMLVDEGRCMADNDGDCEWEGCPQLRERKTTCPRWLATRARLDPDDDGR